MKVLVFGPSGAGKSYVSSKLKEMGINAVGSDLIDGLSNYYDGKGNVVEYPIDADKEFLDNHQFLWNREFLKNYLNQNPNIYLFGFAGNGFEMLDLFDKVYFLEVNQELQKERLAHKSRENPMGQTEYQRENAVSWGLEMEKKARERGIAFVDATLKPEEIYAIIKNI